MMAVRRIAHRLPLPRRLPSAPQRRSLSSWFSRASEFQYSGSLRPHDLSPRRHIPAHLEPPSFQHEKRFEQLPRTPSDIEGISRAAQVAANVLDHACAAARPGASPDDIDRVAHERCIELGAFPTALGFHGFPKSSCASVNEVAVHGIPDTRPLEAGDIISIDCVAHIGGFHGDNCRTVVVGAKPGDEEPKVVSVCRDSIDEAISQVRPGTNFRRLAEVVYEITRANGLGIVREFGGHAVGRSLHGLPTILFHPDDMTDKFVMKPGQTFTIEPIVTEGSGAIITWPDGWTVATRDGSRAAQFEHTVIVTEDGFEVLTLTPDCISKHQKTQAA